jgi:hypothetical protein
MEVGTVKMRAFLGRGTPWAGCLCAAYWFNSKPGLQQFCPWLFGTALLLIAVQVALPVYSLVERSLEWRMKLALVAKRQVPVKPVALERFLESTADPPAISPRSDKLGGEDA